MAKWNLDKPENAPVPYQKDDPIHHMITHRYSKSITSDLYHYGRSLDFFIPNEYHHLPYSDFISSVDEIDNGHKGYSYVQPIPNKTLTKPVSSPSEETRLKLRAKRKKKKK